MVLEERVGDFDMGVGSRDVDLKLVGRIGAILSFMILTIDRLGARPNNVGRALLPYY